MMLSAIPSLRYSAFGSPPTFVNGRIASESSGLGRSAKYTDAAVINKRMAATAIAARRFRTMPETRYSALETAGAEVPLDDGVVEAPLGNTTVAVGIEPE